MDNEGGRRDPGFTPLARFSIAVGWLLLFASLVGTAALILRLYPFRQ